MYDEFDDDNVEDNDLSSDNETGGANDVKTLEPKTNAIKPELENLSGKLGAQNPCNAGKTFASFYSWRSDFFE